MAALTNDSGLFGWFNKPRVKTDSKRAREFTRSVYKETGVTPELKRLNAEFLANQRRDEQPDGGEQRRRA